MLIRNCGWSFIYLSIFYFKNLVSFLFITKVTAFGKAYIFSSLSEIWDLLNEMVKQNVFKWGTERYNICFLFLFCFCFLITEKNAFLGKCLESPIYFPSLLVSSLPLSLPSLFLTGDTKQTVHCRTFVIFPTDAIFHICQYC